MSINSILSKCNYTSDMVKLKLLESHCLPILLYAIESLDVTGSKLKVINSWWNAACIERYLDIINGNRLKY